MPSGQEDHRDAPLLHSLPALAKQKSSFQQLLIDRMGAPLPPCSPKSTAPARHPVRRRRWPNANASCSAGKRPRSSHLTTVDPQKTQSLSTAAATDNPIGILAISRPRWSLGSAKTNGEVAIGLGQETEQSLPIRRRRDAGSSTVVGEEGGGAGAEGRRAWRWWWWQRRSSIPEALVRSQRWKE